MAVAVVQHASNFNEGDIVSVGFNNPVTVGNVLVMVVIWSTDGATNGGTSIIDIPDLQLYPPWADNVWGSAGTLYKEGYIDDSDGPSMKIGINARIASVATADGFSFGTVDSRCNVHLHIYELSGVDLSTIHDEDMNGEFVEQHDSGTVAVISPTTIDPSVAGSQALYVGWFGNGDVYGYPTPGNMELTDGSWDGVASRVEEFFGSNPVAGSGDAAASIGMVFIAESAPPPASTDGCMIALE